MKRSKKQKAELQEITEGTIEIRAMVNFTNQLSGTEYEVMIRYLTGLTVPEIAGTVDLSPEEISRLTSEICLRLLDHPSNSQFKPFYFNDRER